MAKVHLTPDHGSVNNIAERDDVDSCADNVDDAFLRPLIKHCQVRNVCSLFSNGLDPMKVF